MQNNELQHRIEETFRSIDGIKRAEANPFLHTRIMEKLTGAPARTFMKKRVLWPVLAAIVLIIVLNVGILAGTTSTGVENVAEDPYVSINSYSY